MKTALEHIEDVQIIEANNDKEFGEKHFDEYEDINTIPDHLQYFFDYDSYGHDMAYDWGQVEWEGTNFYCYYN